MTIIDKRPAHKPITFADIEVGTLFSPADRMDIICMKTSEFGGAGIIKVNSVNLNNGILYSFASEEEIIPIDNYEFNIF